MTTIFSYDEKLMRIESGATLDLAESRGSQQHRAELQAQLSFHPREFGT